MLAQKKIMMFLIILVQNVLQKKNGFYLYQLLKNGKHFMMYIKITI